MHHNHPLVLDRREESRRENDARLYRVAGGERPALGSSAGDETVWHEGWSALPASARAAVSRTGVDGLGSVDVPTWHVAQCVFDLRWQARSWCANGIAMNAMT